MRDAKMNTQEFWNVTYELGTGGKIKEELGVICLRSTDHSSLYQRADGSSFCLRERFIIKSEYYEEKSFD